MHSVINKHLRGDVYKSLEPTTRWARLDLWTRFVWVINSHDSGHPHSTISSNLHSYVKADSRIRCEISFALKAINNYRPKAAFGSDRTAGSVSWSSAKRSRYLAIKLRFWRSGIGGAGSIPIGIHSESVTASRNGYCVHLYSEHTNGRWPWPNIDMK